MWKGSQDQVVALEKGLWWQRAGDLPHDQMHMLAQPGEYLGREEAQILAIQHVGRKHLHLRSGNLHQTRLRGQQATDDRQPEETVRNTQGQCAVGCPVLPRPGFLHWHTVDDQVLNLVPKRIEMAGIEVRGAEALIEQLIPLLRIGRGLQMRTIRVVRRKERRIVGVDDRDLHAFLRPREISV